MNIIEKIREILTNYEGISQFTNAVHVDFTDAESVDYGLSSTGDSLISEDVLGNQIRQHNFVLYARKEFMEDYNRLANSNWLLDLNYWLESQKGQEITAGNKTGKITKLWSANGMLYEIPNGDINNGVLYQLQIYAEYEIKEEENNG